MPDRHPDCEGWNAKDTGIQKRCADKHAPHHRQPADRAGDRSEACSHTERTEDLRHFQSIQEYFHSVTHGVALFYFKVIVANSHFL